MTTHRRWGLALLAWSALVAAPAGAQSDDREAAGLTAEQAGRLRDALQAYLDAFQALPDPPSFQADHRLRERIIRVVLRLTPPPAVPEEARRRSVRGQALFREALEALDTTRIKDSAGELWQAVRAAPWWPTAAYNLALAQEKLSQYEQARQNFQMYLLASPGAADSSAVQARIYELELKLERTAAEREAARRAAFRKLSGTLWASLASGDHLEARTVEIQDTVIVFDCQNLVPRARCAAGATQLALPHPAVLEIQEKASHKMLGFVVGIPVGVVGGLLYVNSRTPPGDTPADSDVLVGTGIYIAALLAGAGIGSLFPRWKTVYPARRGGAAAVHRLKPPSPRQ